MSLEHLLSVRKNYYAASHSLILQFFTTPCCSALKSRVTTTVNLRTYNVTTRTIFFISTTKKRLDNNMAFAESTVDQPLFL